MRLLTTLVAALPALALAQQQVPLMDQAKGWFDKAAAFAKSAASAPLDAAAAKVAEHGVTPLTFENYRSVIQHSGNVKPYNPPEAWMVYVTGGNKTCRGMCDRMDKAWNESVVYFKSDVSAPKLAVIDCEKSELICGAWGARTGTVWFILVPQPGPDQSPASTDITIHPLNFTTVTNGDITRIHTRKQYLYTEKFEGPLHPFDGWVVKTGLIYPMAYGLWALSKVPSWALMIVVSFFSRSIMGRRMQNQSGARAPGAPGSGAAPAGAAPAAGR